MPEIDREPDPRLVSYFRAAYPLLYMVTAEEARAESEIFIAAKDKRVQRDRIYVWSTTEGIFDVEDSKKREQKFDPKAALEYVKALGKNNVFIFRDLHAFFNSPQIVRNLRDIARDFKQTKNTLIIVSPVAKLPMELQRDAVQIEFELPDRSRIESTFSRLCEKNIEAIKRKNLIIDGDEKDKIIEAAMGLTIIESENAFSKAIVESASGMGSISSLVLKEKALAVKKSGILEYHDTNTSMNEVGGLEVLKKWLKRRSRSFTHAAREYGLPMAKGCLLVGVPGGGKSLSAKAASYEMQVPLIRFDLGKVFGGLVGESESNTRNALATIDALGPCICWIDEMEKAFAGSSGSGGNDSGVTRRVLGTVLTWMQEKSTPSFIVATANSIAGIPPEMLRKGRFDENFYIPEPTTADRKKIFDIHLKKLWKRNTELKIDVESLSKASAGYTGAEIEQAIKEAMFVAFEDDARDINTTDIMNAIKATNPVTRAFATELKEMTTWAKDNAVHATIPEDPKAAGGRVLDL